MPMQVSNALAEQRATKKRAQDDVKLLANRIALLKLEEKKVSRRIILRANMRFTNRFSNTLSYVVVQAWKKIEETR